MEMLMFIRRIWYRLRSRVQRARLDAELADEMRFHQDMLARDAEARGVPRYDARRVAAVRLGSATVMRERSRDWWSLGTLETVAQDIRYAARFLRRSPGFTAVSIISLALGIGANTAVFSLTDAVLLKTLPVAKPRELVLFEWVEGRGQFDRSYDGSMRQDPNNTGFRLATSFSVPAYEYLRAGATTLSDVFGFAPLEQLNVVAGGNAELADGQLVTGNYYAGLGVRALLGRTINAEDDRQGAQPVAVLTYRYWQSRFAADKAIIGSGITINGIAATIVGVTPPGFTGTLEVGESPALTVPMSLVTALSPGSSGLTSARRWWIRVMGRRRPGVTEAIVQTELAPVFQRAAMEWATGSSTTKSAVSPADLPTLRIESGSRGLNDERDDYRRPVTFLSVVAGLILLIACANVANLLLTRATTRQREITVRLALGANRSRIVGQLLVESVLLVVGAEALGLLFAYWGRSLLLTLRPTAMQLHLALDLRVLAAATLLSVLTAFMFGLAPALRATRLDVIAGLKESVRNTGRMSPSIVSRSLVVAQIAMSVVLLLDAALFLRTLQNLRGVDVGFNPNQLLLFRINARLSGYGDSTIPPLYRRLQTQLSGIPGVRLVTFARHPQLAGSHRSSSVSVVGRPPADIDTPINLVGPEFFETMQLPIVLGRAFTPRDDEHAPRVAIVNETFVRKYFPGESPIGRRLGDSGTEAEIVGIARDAKYYSIRQFTEPIVYVPYVQHDQGQATFILRTAVDPFAVVPAVRRAVHDLDPTLSIAAVRTQRDATNATMGEERLFAKLATLFGALALVLASIGVYGVLSYATARRTAEIGIRIALGADGRSILWLVARRTLALVVLGTVVGLMAGVAGARLFATLLYGLAPMDPRSIAVTVSLIAGVALAAGYVPANRARRVSPLIALRNE